MKAVESVNVEFASACVRRIDELLCMYRLQLTYHEARSLKQDRAESMPLHAGSAMLLSDPNRIVAPARPAFNHNSVAKATQEAHEGSLDSKQQNKYHCDRVVMHVQEVAFAEQAGDGREEDDFNAEDGEEEPEHLD